VAWKTFLRGHNPILYDLGIVGGASPSDPSAAIPGTPSYAAFEPARSAVGDTLRYAQKVRLAEPAPRGDLSSTGYALANPSREYLVLQPSETAGPFTVTLEAGTYMVQWYSVTTRETKEAGTLTVESDGCAGFTAPFTESGPAVLYLKHVGRR
jgi:hypothetical protein